jgi:uncharacterized protein YjiK
MSLSLQAQKTIKLKPTKQVSIDVPEPSDICYNPDDNSFYIVSDQGILFENDENGKVIRKMKEKDTDFEAVYVDAKNVYAVDESGRTIYEYDKKTLKKNKTTYIKYDGPKNKGYESFTFNADKNKYLLITESKPILVFELDTNFNVIKQTDISGIARDISSARFYKNDLYLLSDEDMMLIKVNPETYEVIQKWYLPVINPEGLAFDKDGNILITCDDMQRLYYFNNPEKK